MKEINAIIRMNKIQKVKDALQEAGYPSVSVHSALGRGKQRGLMYNFTKYLDEPEEVKKLPSQFLAKRMLIIVVEDKCAEKVTKIIIEASQTGKIGDGKIFVLPILEVVRVRTGETGDSALL